MENVIAKLLEDFERGRMTRRQLIRSLALAASAAGATLTPGSALAAAASTKPPARSLAAAMSPAAARTAAESAGFTAVAVNHISYQVADYARTRDFYAGLLGMKVIKDTGTQCYLLLGGTNTFVIPRNAPAGVTPPRVDHIAYTISGWDRKAVGEELQRRGLKPVPDTENSYHIADPNGFDVQIAGQGMTPYTA